MRSFQMQDIRGFMHKLLATDTFDRFQVTKGELTTFCTWSVDGTMTPEQEDPSLEDAGRETAAAQSGYSFVPWAMLRPHFYELIKGKAAPSRLTITFRLPDAGAQTLLSQSGSDISAESVSGLYLHVRYTGNALSCVTGVSLNVFTLDKRLEHYWDDSIARFLKQKELAWL